MQCMQKQDRQRPPRRGEISRMPGKSQETKEIRLEEKPRQNPKETPRANEQQASKFRTQTELYWTSKRTHGRGLGRGLRQWLGRHANRLPMHLSRPKTSGGRRRRAHDSQTQGTTTGPYTPVDHGRSNDMDDISPDRIPAGKGRGWGHEQHMLLWSTRFYQCASWRLASWRLHWWQSTLHHAAFPSADIHVWIPFQRHPFRRYILHLDTWGLDTLLASIVHFLTADFWCILDFLLALRR